MTLRVALLLLFATPTLAATDKRPPLGWSSWYAFGGGVNQSLMEETFNQMVNRSVKAGDNRSLLDVGYRFANLDDNWQACGQGVNGSFHDAKCACSPVLLLLQLLLVVLRVLTLSVTRCRGFPMMDGAGNASGRFPNVTAMTAKAHALGLSPG